MVAGDSKSLLSVRPSQDSTRRFSGSAERFTAREFFILTNWRSTHFPSRSVISDFDLPLLLCSCSSGRWVWGRRGQLEFRTAETWSRGGMTGSFLPPLLVELLRWDGGWRRAERVVEPPLLSEEKICGDRGELLRIIKLG